MPYKDPKKAKDYKRQYFQRMKDDPEFREKRNKIWKTYYGFATAQQIMQVANKIETIQNAYGMSKGFGY